MIFSCPFCHAGDAHDRFSSGSGRGLSITTRAVRLRGRTVKVENRLDAGLLIELRLSSAAK